MTIAGRDETVSQLLSKLAAPNFGPILIQGEDDRAAVLMSTAQYQRMRSDDLEDFTRFCEGLSERVQSRGLTEEKLAHILSEIDAETPR